MSRLVKKRIRKAKSRLEREIADKKEDNGKLFRNYVKSKTKLKQPVGPLKGEGTDFITDPKEMATELNKFFSSVFTKENVLTDPTKNLETEATLSEIEITEK